jgi:hypothetical protein
MQSHPARRIGILSWEPWILPAEWIQLFATITLFPSPLVPFLIRQNPPNPKVALRRSLDDRVGFRLHRLLPTGNP